ncbi:hypothetical protein AWB91_24560 [Mycobacterium paraense]|uniref:Uncharacterized protein n=1 Tax=Mycobacterium paraense TaxID=767916 RepID=A0ABX3VIJ2_9MYCO|nr:hypothetical protein [Mycobacterium paraense]ORW29199.1 hypothetical protein AWB91_24560 [Mycobacterium paraense]ORW40358.1 hypothetical protein AWB88_13565 [Mycobacterium paraense]
MTEQIEDRHNPERQINWDNYAYTLPFTEALTRTFAVPFGNQDIGGNVYVAHDGFLEGGVYLVVGSGFDCPTMTVCERVETDDGYGVGICNREGYTLACAEDQTATTPEDVVVLAKKALALASEYDISDSTYTLWTRHLDGSETRGRERG